MSAIQPAFVYRFVPGSGDPTTLLLLHGTGGDENDLLPLGHELRPSAALVSPRGKVLEDGMPRFFRRLAPGVFDREDLIARTHELADFVRAASAAHALDPTGIVAVGYSNGANVAASMLLLRPEILSGAILLRPMVPLEPEIPPDLGGRSALVLAARRDPIVPPSESERLSALLRSFGADVELVWVSGGHGLTAVDLETSRRWLSQHRAST